MPTAPQRRFASVYCLCILPVVLGFIAAPARATTRTVTNLNDSGAGSLRATIAAAAAGDTINFSVSGTLTLTSGALVINRNLTITGPGAGITVSGNNSSRVFNITAGTVSISGVTISQGRVMGVPNPFTTGQAGTGSGGGIANEGTLALTNCTLSNNLATGGPSTAGAGQGGDGSGGGIANGGTLILANCTLSGNSASGGQGGPSGGRGGLGSGGGIANNGTLTMLDCTLSSNHSSGGSGGGGGNNGDAEGGGIANSGSLNVTNSTIANNNAVGAPGGISGGSAGDGCGGGIVTSGTATIINSTLSGNTASGAPGPTVALGIGGGIYQLAPAQFRNTIVVNNHAFSSSTIGYGQDVAGNGTSQGHNLIGIVNDSNGWIASDQTGTLGTPLNPHLSVLQNNGGPTATMVPLNGSPAIDAGDDAVLTSPYNLTTDQRGPGFPRRRGAHVDIGATEFDSPVSGPTFIVTTTDDHNDGACGQLDCTLREAVNAANAASGGNTIQFAAGVTGTITLTAGELAINDTLLLQGPGASVITVDGNQAGRVFRIGTAGLAVTITDLTISRGFVNGGTAQGGGIFNNGNLTLRNCLLSLHQATGSNGGDGRGGALFNSGAATITNCTFSRNGANGGDGVSGGPNPGGNGQGASLYNSGTMTLTNCTVNAGIVFGGTGGASCADIGCIGGNGGNGQGGGIYNSGTLTVTSGTLSSNAAHGGQGGFGGISGPFGSGQGGGIFQGGTGSSIVRNTIVTGDAADSSGPDAFGAFSSQGYNLIGKRDDSSGFTATTDQTGTAASPFNAMLGPLQDNGGPTPTQALQTGSPALDKGRSFSLTTDQRGLTRPIDDPTIPNAAAGDGSDIGAFELQPVATFQFSAASYSVAENAGSATITVTRTGNINYAATASYATSDGTAKAGSDYTATTGTLSFAAGDASKTFTVSILNDATCESIESLTLSLNSLTGGTTLGSPSTATLTIYDDDCSYTINGRVANNSGTGIPNVQITRSGGSNVVTDSNGNYTFTGVKQGNYTIAPLITPSLSGVTFFPPTTNVTVNTSSLNNINFTVSFTVTGKVSNSSGVGIPNIQVTRKTSNSSVTAITGSNGNYTFTGVRSGSYTIASVVTPSMTGISFFPTSTNVSVNTSNLTNINFTAFFSVSGHIANSGGTAIPNVLVRLSTSTSSTSVSTDSNGNYTFSGVRSGSYTVTPTLSGKTFNPTSKSVTVGTANLTNINFIGS
jgi:CSLREA domain-containing protein